MGALKGGLFIFGLLVFLTCFSPSAIGKEVNLAWDPIGEADVVGYKIYYKEGAAPGIYDGTAALQGPSPIDAGNVGAITVSGLSDQQTYCFAATAYDQAGYESGYSNQVCSEGQGTGCTDSDSDGFALEGGDCGAIDCNDQESNINPGAPEEPYNGLDENCNGLADDDDLDKDGYPVATDCNDNDSNLHPGLSEICDDTLDNDCDGLADSADAECTASFQRRVSADTDDAEEGASGSVYMGSSDLELVFDSYDRGEQTVGIRFSAVDIPRGASIVQAYVQFQVDEPTSAPATILFNGEASDDSAPFSDSLDNISSRKQTTAEVSWSPAPWTTAGSSGAEQQSPDISTVIQEIVSRSGWSQGNALSLIVTGSGERVAESYAGDPAGAPLLNVVYAVSDEGSEPNLPPTVSAGANQNIALPDLATLNGAASDDGLPTPPGALTLTWSKIDGPGTVSFSDAASAETTASFSDSGTYVLRLRAFDGALGADDEVTVVVAGEEGEVVTEARVMASPDDAEEGPDGSIYLDSSDLELVFDSYDRGQQTVGLRFTQVDIPQGATIHNAYLQFQADENSTADTFLYISGENSDNSESFSTLQENISSRLRTSAEVSWSPAAWTSVGAAGADQRTPNLALIVQEIVDRPGWSRGNSLSVIFTGTGKRVAESFDGLSGGAPSLHITYSGSGGGSPTNKAPQVTAMADQTVVFPESAFLNGSVSDDGLPNPPGTVETTWSLFSGPGTVTIAVPHAESTTAEFSDKGSYVLQLSASDGELTTSDQVVISVTEPGEETAVEVRVSDDADDAEEGPDGSIYIGSSDLELVYDSYDKGQQTVGIRFAGLGIPQGATIVDAFLQFKVDERTSIVTSLYLRGEATDHAAPFNTTTDNISSRPITSTEVFWSPPAWTRVGEADLGQRTPNIASIIQEVVDRPGWSAGNAIAIIISGSGERIAESFSGNPGGAPLLRVVYK